MKQTKSLLFFAIAGLSTFSSFATESLGETGLIVGDVILNPKNPTNPDRPKLPNRQQIECVYQSGSLKFSFAIPEGECQLTVTDMTTGFSRQYVFDSSAEATVYVGTLTQAHIEISTANGHEYEGWLGMEG